MMRKPHSFMIDTKLHDQLRRLSAVRGKSISDEMHTALERYLDKHYPAELDTIAQRAQRSMENEQQSVDS